MSISLRSRVIPFVISGPLKQMDTVTRVMLLGFAGTLALFFVAPTATQRMAYYLFVCIPAIVTISRGEVVWRLFYGRLGLALASTFVAIHVLTILWTRDFAIGNAIHDTKDAITLIVFAYALTWFGLYQRNIFWQTFRNIFVGSAALTGLLAIVLHFGSASPDTPLQGFGVAEHTNAAGTLYGVAAILAALTGAQTHRHWADRTGWIFAATVSVVCVLLSESRAGILALAITAAVVAPFLRVSGRHLVVLTGVIGTTSAIFLLSGQIDVKQMIAEGSNSRFQLWSDAITYIRERPILGHGILAEIRFEGTEALYRSPHNLFLSTQVFAGLGASITLIFLIYLSLSRSFVIAHNGSPLLLGLLVFGLTNGLFAFRTLVDGMDRMWLAFWIPILLTHTEYAWQVARGQTQEPVHQA